MSTEFTHHLAEDDNGTVLGTRFARNDRTGFQWAVGGTELVRLLRSGFVTSESGEVLLVSEFLNLVSELHEVHKFLDEDVRGF